MDLSERSESDEGHQCIKVGNAPDIKRNQEMEGFKDMLYNPHFLRTIVVTGPRGSGTSAALFGG